MAASCLWLSDAATANRWRVAIRLPSGYPVSPELQGHQQNHPGWWALREVAWSPGILRGRQASSCGLSLAECALYPALAGAACVCAYSAHLPLLSTHAHSASGLGMLPSTEILVKLPLWEEDSLRGHRTPMQQNFLPPYYLRARAAGRASSESFLTRVSPQFSPGYTSVLLFTTGHTVPTDLAQSHGTAGDWRTERTLNELAL